jgi:hydrogenase large subunit
MAAAKNVGNAFGFNVHVKEDTNPEDITVAGHLVRDVIYGSNFVASHLVHLYQLAALDFVDTALIGLDKAPFCPRFGPASNPGDPTYDYYYRFNAATTAYLVGQYVTALKFRRVANQIGAIWGGRAPFVQGLLPGGVSTSVSQAAINKTRELLYIGKSGDSGYPGTPSAPAAGTLLNFIGSPLDYATPKTGTMMYDTVAVAHTYPEYFWLGNAYERFLAYGVFEKGNTSNPIGDQRLLSRGRKKTGAKYPTQTNLLPPVTFSTSPPQPGWNPADQLRVYENIQSSYYSYSGVGIPASWRHPWNGETTPSPAKSGAYSWVKSPRYNDDSDTAFLHGGHGVVPYEVGPLSRMMVTGYYWAGFLYDAGYTLTPQYGDDGPDLNSMFPGLGLPDLGPGGLGLKYKGDSALDRYAGRQLECWLIANAMVNWLNTLEGSYIGAVTSKTRSFAGSKVPDTAQGYGWTEAPRGALGHWIKIDNKKISLYQCVVPSTWNASPEDAFGQKGPAEKAMENVPVNDVRYPLEILRVSHSWDFCTACAVHLVKRNKNGVIVEENNVNIDPTHPM